VNSSKTEKTAQEEDTYESKREYKHIDVYTIERINTLVIQLFTDKFIFRLTKVRPMRLH
jgi:hypothetical protein